MPTAKDWNGTCVPSHDAAAYPDGDALRRDAARYRWLRDHPKSTWTHIGVPIKVFRCDVPITYRGELPANLDAAIDAAMAEVAP